MMTMQGRRRSFSTMVVVGVLILSSLSLHHHHRRHYFGQAWLLDTTHTCRHTHRQHRRRRRRRRLSYQQFTTSLLYSRNDDDSSSSSRLQFLMNDTTTRSSSTSSSCSILCKDSNNFFIPKSSPPQQAAECIVWSGDTIEAITTTKKQQHQQPSQGTAAAAAAASTSSRKDEFAAFQRAIEQVHALLDLYQQGEERHPFTSTKNNKNIDYHLAGKSSSSSSSMIAPDIVLTALETIVLQSSSSWSTTTTTTHMRSAAVLKLLQGLVDRVAQETVLVPSWHVMDTLLIMMMTMMQQQEPYDSSVFENDAVRGNTRTYSQNNNNNNMTATQHTDQPFYPLHHQQQQGSLSIITSTLYHWYQWALADQMAPPPRLYLVQLLKRIHHAQQKQRQQQQQHQSSHHSSTTDPPSLMLWDLYITAHSFSRKHEAPLPRQCYEWMLAISLSLSLQSFEWQDKTCLVLRDMMKWSTTSRDDGDGDDDNSLSLRQYCPTPAEWTSVLEQAASLGRIHDVVWLIRTLQQQGNDVESKDKNIGSEESYSSSSSSSNDNNDNKYTLYFVQSLLHSTEAGALHYMEQYVFSQDFMDDNDNESHQILGKKSFQMLLQKWSKARIPGAGMRAEAVFQRLEERFRMENDNDKSSKTTTMSIWRPDEACVQSVALAYLQDYSVSLSHVMDAENFVRDCVAKGYLEEGYSGAASVGVFDRLLQAYTSYGITDPKAANRADELFRYYLIQHRSGLIAEEPGPHHLKHLLRQFHRLPAVTPEIVQKSLEYYKLISLLRSRNAHIVSQPDVLNARQVLRILARGNQTELGSAAETILRNAMTNNNLT